MLRYPLLLAAPLVLCAQTATRPYPRPGAPLLTVGGRKVEVRVTPVTGNTARLTIAPLDGGGSALPFPDEPAIAPRAWGAPAARIRSLLPAQTYTAGALKVEVATGDGVRFGIFGLDGRPVQSLHVSADTGAVSFSLGAKPLFGLGQGGAQYDRRGNKHLMKTGAVDLALNGMRVPVPWLVSPEGWAVFVNRPKGEWDLTGREGLYIPFAEEAAAPVDVFVSAADGAQLMKELAVLTGFPTLPPLWSLGYQQSHRTVWDREHRMRIAANLRSKKLPCDLLIYLGTGWCPSGWNEWHGSFDFNRKMFPEPEKDIAELQAMNFKVALHVVGIPTRLYGTVSDPVTAAPDLNQVVQYWRLHQPVSKMGLNGWWPDVGEDQDDAARIARIRMYWEGPQLDHPNLRPFALHRTGYAGMQRYGGWLWSGDVNSTWATLKAHVAVAINTSLSGIPHWGTDIGGFFSTKELTGELYVRWFQFSAFSPLFRSHGRPSQTRFPWGWNTGELGPEEMEGTATIRGSALPDTGELSNPRVEPICRKYLELRYRLLPYTYSLFREAAETGMPIQRALWLHYPGEARAMRRDDEYLWGRDMLVAPVVEKGATSRAVYLPPGTWYDFWTNDRTEGGREIQRAVDLETLPLYVRSGAILPMGPVRQYTSEPSNEPLVLTVYPGSDGRFDLYEDDGTSFDYQKGDFLLARCQWDDARRRLTVTRVAGGRAPSPQLRRVQGLLADSKQPLEVLRNW